MAEHIPYLSLEYQHTQIRHHLEGALKSVLDGQRFILGEHVTSFEREFAAYCGTTWCVGVGNGLDALTLALLSLHAREGTEVIVPAHTYVATWLAVSRTGATIVPVDADPHTFNIDPAKLESTLSPKTKIVLPVHMYGQPCDMTALELFAEKNQLFIVEDNAQAHGATWLQRKTGSFGVINATSFYPTKNLGALGDGGAVTSNDRSLVDFVRRNRNYGMKEKDITVEKGINSRLDEMQASVLNIKLKMLDEWNGMRAMIANRYLENLKDVGDLTLPLCDKEASHVYHLFVIRTGRRDLLRKFLHDNGVETMVHYPYPPHLQPAYENLGFKKGDFPVAESIADTAISLPIWPGMTEGQISYVIETLKRYFSIYL